METETRRWGLATALAIVAAAAMLGLAACGGDDSAAGEGEGGSAAAAESASDPAVEYAQCMRENGVPEFPDPVNGQTQLRVGPDSGIDPDSAAFKSAQQACEDKAPAGAQSGSGGNPEMEEQVLKFAKCMRENGVPEFPDPQVNGGGVRMQLPQGVDQNSPQFLEAQQACSDILAGLGGGR